MSALKIFVIAWRNLWRQKRRTILTLISIAFGGFFAIMMTSMQDQTWVDFIDTVARMGSGHVTLQHPDYQDRPTLSRAVEQTDAKRAAVLTDAEVAVAVDRTSGQAMLSTANDSFGGFFIAYDPTQETEQTLEWTQGLQTGELFTSAHDDGIVLGRVLAENLGAELGDKIVFTLTDRSGEIVAGMERLRGTISTGADSTDAGIVLLPMGTVRDLVGYSDTESTQVAVFLENGRHTLSASERIDELIGDDAAVLTWDQIQPEIRTFIAMKKGGGAVMSIVLAILVAAGIFSTIFMSVLERAREFGIMRAIGYSPGQLFLLVMAESGFLAVLGLLSSAAVTAYPYYALSKTGLDFTEMMKAEGMEAMDINGVAMDVVMPFGIFPESALAIAAAIVLATLAAGLYPAWKAGRVDPIESINLV